jgi:GT2 family glycosyltransferase
MDQTYSNFETIFVDNASKDRSLEIARDQKYKSLSIKFAQNTSNLGFSPGNNDGYKLSSGDIIFLLNTDARVEPDTLEKVVNTFNQNPNVGIIQNKTLLMKDHTKLDSAGSMFTKTGFLKHIGRKEAVVDEEKMYPIFAGKGCSLFIRREIIEATYLFNPDYHSYFEDTDISWRCWLLGKEVVYSPEGISYHNGGTTALKLTSGFTDYHSFKNRIQCMLVNLQLRNILIVIPVHVFLCLGISLMYLVRGRFLKSWSIIKAIGWNIGHIGRTLRLRREVQSKRVWSDKQIFDLVSTKFDIMYSIKSLFNYTSW